MTASTPLVFSKVSSDSPRATVGSAPLPASATASPTGFRLTPPATLIWFTAICTGAVSDFEIESSSAGQVVPTGLMGTPRAAHVRASA